MRVTFTGALQPGVTAKDMALDVGAAYLYLRDSDINNDLRAEGKGLVKGTYDASGWLIGTQFSMFF